MNLLSVYTYRVLRVRPVPRESVATPDYRARTAYRAKKARAANGASKGMQDRPANEAVKVTEATKANKVFPAWMHHARSAQTVYRCPDADGDHQR